MIGFLIKGGRVEMSGIPETEGEIKAAILARREAIVICLQESAMLGEKLRALIGPVAWLQWQQENVKNGQDDVLGEFIKKHQRG